MNSSEGEEQEENVYKPEPEIIEKIVKKLPKLKMMTEIMFDRNTVEKDLKDE
jgi:hypothetical protein